VVSLISWQYVGSVESQSMSFIMANLDWSLIGRRHIGMVDCQVFQVLEVFEAGPTSVDSFSSQFLAVVAGRALARA